MRLGTKRKLLMIGAALLLAALSLRWIGPGVVHGVIEEMRRSQYPGPG
jgi:hypothetical protein